jgi:hypothetical protein
MKLILNLRKLEIRHILDQHELIEIRQAVFNVDSKTKFDKNHSSASSFRDEICEQAATIPSSCIPFIYFVQKCINLTLSEAVPGILTGNTYELNYLSVALTSCCLGSANVLNAAYDIDVLCIVFCLPSCHQHPLSPIWGGVKGNVPFFKRKINPGEVIMRG